MSKSVPSNLYEDVLIEDDIPANVTEKDSSDECDLREATESVGIVAEETVTFSMTFTPEQLQIFETRYENGYVNYITSHVCT